MKKIIIILVLLLFVGGASSIYYFFELKEYKIEDAVVGQITDAGYKIELPKMEDKLEESPFKDYSIKHAEDNGRVEEGNESGKEEQPKEASKKTEPEPAPKQVDNNEAGEKNESKEKLQEKPKITAKTVIEKYRPTFESLEDQANGKIDALINRAINEYKEKKANGEKISFSYFFRKYKTAGDEMEAKTDQTFQQIYGSLKQDLEKRGFDPSQAQVVKEQYEKAKSKRRTELLEKAIAQLK